ncbi:MAG: LemA family protein [Solirubrobacterales bacterium]
MLIALLIVGALIALLGVYAVVVYNRLVRLRVGVDERESDIDVQLKRRHDLVPNLVETVKGYASHESETFQRVTEARAAAMDASGPADRAVAESQLTSALGGLRVVAEDYPELKADANFRALQDELTATENRIQAARRQYNMQVRALNTGVEQFPSSVVAGATGFSQREFFEIEDDSQRAVPQVSFSE